MQPIKLEIREHEVNALIEQPIAFFQGAMKGCQGNGSHEGIYRFGNMHLDEGVRVHYDDHQRTMNTSSMAHLPDHSSDLRTQARGNWPRRVRHHSTSNAPIFCSI